MLSSHNFSINLIASNDNAHNSMIKCVWLFISSEKTENDLCCCKIHGMYVNRVKSYEHNIKLISTFKMENMSICTKHSLKLMFFVAAVAAAVLLFDKRTSRNQLNTHLYSFAKRCLMRMKHTARRAHSGKEEIVLNI